MDDDKRDAQSEGRLDNAAAPPSRRRFLAGAAAGTVAAGFPMVSFAQTEVFNFQSTWNSRDIFHEYAADFVRTVNEMSGGRLRLNLLPTSAVVGAFQLQDAVVKGVLDGGHGVAAYWSGKTKAFSLFGTPPPFGWDAHQFLGWIKYGGGQQLYDELVAKLGLDLVGFLTGPMPSQPLGWFREPIREVAQLRGMKYRTVGLAADVMREFGAAVVVIGSGDVVPAIERGLLEGAEFNNPSSDRMLGFPDVSKTLMLRSYHQDCESFEIIFNRTRFTKLPRELQAIVKYAAEASSSDMYWKAMHRYPKDLEKMRTEQGVKTYLTPDAILEAQLRAWDVVIARESEADPFFRKIIASQKAYCEKTVAFHIENNTPKEAAYRHFFGRRPTASSDKL
ncbi:TRAP transporter substrate-binding protein [Pseudazoarcus pumilus]|uniref:C4-dicarboxylate ABC transporter n=1 Tax=Pseudazoarcus pumilus TaxID=2067960 RepID=A0A2I6S7Q2_9RHOO|nr:TRAP transporter substrate-binding protein [Pseudazoarcus pumilus]AUN95284.1 C4-dicarboxylate ABC transporter [Pseudazoarcus pumilus]